MEVFLLLLLSSAAATEKLDLTLHMDPLKHSEAKDKCKKENRNLLLPRDLDVLERFRNNLELRINNSAWIGLAKISKGRKSSWYFSDGKKVPDDFEFWDVDQPASDGDCATMDGRNKMQTRVLKTKLPFVCEKKLSGKQKCDNAKDMWKYDNKCLKVVHTPGYCSVAKSNCKRLGATLAIVTTQKEFEDIQKEIILSTLDKRVWVGLEKINGKWVLEDKAEPLEIDNMWMEGTKIDKHTKCAVLSTRFDRLFPVKCNQHTAYPICQSMHRLWKNVFQTIINSSVKNTVFVLKVLLTFELINYV
ncbi:uncharacterized protein [Centruroides vittatus]|uniref:uncharacterized protein n=1 Tax=Centruroides vittatus TaxID=120091 RepID=UPI00350F3AF4